MEAGTTETDGNPFEILFWIAAGFINQKNSLYSGNFFWHLFGTADAVSVGQDTPKMLIFYQVGVCTGAFCSLQHEQDVHPQRISLECLLSVTNPRIPFHGVAPNNKNIRLIRQCIKSSSNSKCCRLQHIRSYGRKNAKRAFGTDAAWYRRKCTASVLPARGNQASVELTSSRSCHYSVKAVWWYWHLWRTFAKKNLRYWGNLRLLTLLIQTILLLVLVRLIPIKRC